MAGESGVPTTPADTEEAHLAALGYSKVRDEWTAIAQKYIDRYGIFDNWGMYCYTSASYKPWGDFLTELDIGIWEERLDDETWAGWIDFKSEIAKVSLKYGGSISNCHGTTRVGDAELVPEEMGGGWDVMLKIKRALDPNNIMNPGKQMLDRASRTECDVRLRLQAGVRPPRGDQGLRRGGDEVAARLRGRS